MNKSKTTEIKFTVQLDEKNVPQSIVWNAADSGNKEDKDCKSIMITLWDTKVKNTMSIGLWTKDMMVDEMTTFFFQTLISFAENHENATGNKIAVAEIKKFCNDFSDKLIGKKS